MGHLYNYREGWQSENLANYILSKFSFVAQPTNVSNDIGTDFYCTLFKVTKIKSTNYLDTITTVCVQIKSNLSDIDLTNKIQYLSDLMIPFFVGVVDKDGNKLTIYSGEIIPIYFSHKNHDCKKLTVKLSNTRPDDKDLVVKNGDETTLIFPKVKDFTIDDDYLKNPDLIKELIDLSIIIQENISSKTLKEYSFQTYSKDTIIHGNNDSLQVFRLNFLRRLSEYLYNLYIIKDLIDKGAKPAEDRYSRERELFLKFYDDLNNLYKADFTAGNDFPEFLKQIRDKLK